MKTTDEEYKLLIEALGKICDKHGFLLKVYGPHVAVQGECFGCSTVNKFQFHLNKLKNADWYYAPEDNGKLISLQITLL